MAITFQVDLSTVQMLGTKQPYGSPGVSTLTDPVSGAPVTLWNYFAQTRSTWFPDILRNNRQLKHGDEFQVSGQDAIYLLNNFTHNYPKVGGVFTDTPDRMDSSTGTDQVKFLRYVSGTAV